LDSTEPVNYRGSYITVTEEIVDLVIDMSQSAVTVIMDTITIAPRTIVTTAMQLLLVKLMVSEQEGGMRK
jgi:hypothetical protein